jgi:NCS1 family nucleobase:cation symporter-1
VKKIELHPETSTYSDGILFSNKSLDPIPQHSKERKWEWFSILGFWIAEAMSISMYQVASSSISAGLSPGLAILAIFVGHIIVSIPAMLNAYVGAKYGIGFPLLMRFTGGAAPYFSGSHILVGIRGIVCVIWCGTQSFQGGLCVQSMLEAIWPSFANFENHLPESAKVTSAELLCFFLFVFIQLPVLYLSVNQLRIMFMVKIILLPIFGIVLFAWAVHGARGFGPIFSQGNNILDGTPTIVVFFRCVVSAIGPKATLALNISDFTRYAKKPKQVWWPQFIGLVVLVTLCGILGIVVTSATQVIYGVSTWNPLQVENLWNNRAAKFFSSACWSFAIIGTNVSANTVSFSYDLSLWFPRWINARRGAYVCMALGIVVCPWFIQYSAKSFSSFLGGYSMFLAPIAGIMCTDYYILRGRKLNLPGLYKSDGPYRFYHGYNIPCFIAFLCGIAPNLPGLAWVCGNQNIPKAAIYLYSISYVPGILIGAAVYYGICKYFPKLWMADLESFEEDPGNTFVDPKEDEFLEGIELEGSAEEGSSSLSPEKNDTYRVKAHSLGSQ